MKPNDTQTNYFNGWRLVSSTTCSELRAIRPAAVKGWKYGSAIYFSDN